MIAQKQRYKTVARSSDLMKTKLPNYYDNSHKEKDNPKTLGANLSKYDMLQKSYEMCTKLCEQ